MTIMWLNLSITFVLSFFSRYFSTPIPSVQNFIRPNRFLVFLVALTFIIIAGLRNNVGDTYFYIHSYKINTFTWSNIDYSRDFGFDIFQMFLQKISRDPQILILTTATVTNLLIVIILYKYTRIFELSIYMYITSDMFTTSMNGIREFFAAALVFSATKYIINGNFKKYAIIIIFAALIHKSALILFPIYFIVRRKAWTKVTMLLLSTSILIVLGFNQFSGVLFSALQDTQYGHYSSFDEGGANIYRVAVNAVPVIIAFFGRQKLKQLWPNSDYIVNMAIINTVFYIISLQNWIFARFTIYFGLYNLILMSWIPLLFRKRDGRLLYYVFIVLYFIYFYYEHVITWGFIYHSNYINI